MVFIVTCTIFFPAHHRIALSQSPTTQTQKVESEDARVDRAGTWSKQTAGAASSGSYLYGGGGANDSLGLHFYGSTVEIIYVSGPQLGTLAIEVDGTVLRTVITAADVTAYNQSAKINYLSDEWHTVRVYAQEGGTVAIDAFVANLDAPPPTFVDPTANPDRPAGSSAGATTPPANPAPSADTVRAPRLAELGHILINEVDADGPDAVELFNPTTAAVNITGWQVRIYYNNALDVTWTLPTFALYPGAYVTLYESAGSNTGTALYYNQNTNIEMDLNGAVALVTNSNTGVDFFRWGGSTINPTAPDTWSGSPTFTYNSAQSLGRNEQNDDDNSSTDWFAQCPTLGKANDACLVLNEFYVGGTDAVEIFNPTSTTITLTGYQFTSYSSVTTVDGTYTFPAASIPAGGYVVISEAAGTNTATTFYANFNFAWNAGDGGGLLTTGVGGSVVDFARWGSTTVAPAGAGWFGGALPVAGTDESSLQRRPSSEDGDRTSDFCFHLVSLGTLNRPCVVINEIYGGDPDGVEIYNASLAAYTLTGFQVIIYDYDGTAGVNFVFPAFTLNPMSYVRVFEGVGTNTAAVLFGGGSLGWIAGDSGAAQLYNEGSNGVDFVRLGSNNTLGLNGANFISPNAPVFPTLVNASTVGRNTSGGDFDEGADWCVQPITPGYSNYGCPARLAVFAPSLNYVSLVDSTANPPAPNAYLSYGSGSPAATANGQWVMGDWDGDGRQTPGVYVTSGASAGVFYTTNDVGATPNWTATWFGLFAGVAGNQPVVGRFAVTANDCLGVMDSQNFPPYGTAFALYYTCVTSGGNPAKTVQWNSVLLPDSGGFSGTFQFGAGDFDGNGIDSIACRRGTYITWSNTNPNTVNGTFPNAQYFASPVAGSNNFVVGDFDNNGVDSFGLFFPASNGTVYFKNDLAFNSGAIPGSQTVGLPIGTATTATTWKGY
ncbi:MAG: lamin tail domain-containing protein [Chloroflexi bacterium]|nr:lamin tail domain-containing protein [Chloroflexota bacterium]